MISVYEYWYIVLKLLNVGRPFMPILLIQSPTEHANKANIHQYWAFPFSGLVSLVPVVALVLLSRLSLFPLSPLLVVCSC